VIDMAVTYFDREATAQSFPYASHQAESRRGRTRALLRRRRLSLRAGIAFLSFRSRHALPGRFARIDASHRARNLADSNLA
jgi:hypothetical protein